MKGMAEDVRTREIVDENRERLIKHWEGHLSDSLQAVYVAQHQLETLYKQRYEEVTVPLESTGYQRRLDQEIAAAALAETVVIEAA